MIRLQFAPTPGRQAQGFALLEALVAILLFVLGVLGLMGLQTSMTLAQTETRARSEAAYLAQELIGLMWADIGNIDSYAITAGAPSGTPPTSASCTADACQRWLAKMQNILPQGNAQSTLTATTENDSTNAAITLFWTMPNGETRRYDTATNIAVSYTP